MTTIEYHGESFRLVRAFDDYDEYKEAAENIDPDELGRIEAKILAIEIPAEFETIDEFVVAALDIKFPGFGLGGLLSDDDIYTTTIELPEMNAYRYITVREKAGRWHVVDDFRGPIAFHGTAVELRQGELIYTSHEGREFRRVRVE